MTEQTTYTVPPGLADVPLNVRLARDAEILREQREAIDRRHETICASERAYRNGLIALFMSNAAKIKAALSRLG